MSEESSNKRELEREERRLQRLRLVVVSEPQRPGAEQPVEDFEPDPKEAA
jgi:hypothetical protein